MWEGSKLIESFSEVSWEQKRLTDATFCLSWIFFLFVKMGRKHSDKLMYI